MLTKSKALQVIETELFGAAVHGCITENSVTNTVVEDCRRPAVADTTFDFGREKVLFIFEYPGVALLVHLQAWEVVAFIEVFEDGGEDFGVFVGQPDAFRGVEEALAAEVVEVGAACYDVFVGGKEALGRPDGDGNDCGVEVPDKREMGA